MSSSSSRSQNEGQPATESSKKRKFFKLFGAEIEIDEPISTDPCQDEVQVDHDVEKALIRLCKVDSSVVREDMDYFLSRVGNDDVELSKKHLNLFTSMCVANALCTLYLSPLKDNRELGVRVIEQFITAVESFSSRLNVYVIPLVLQFCTCLRKKETRDQIYYDCRGTLRLLFDNVIFEDSSAREVWRLVAWQEIFQFVIEIGNKLLDEMTMGLESSSEDIVEFEGGLGFSSFVSAVLNGILNTADLDYPIRMPYGALRYPFSEQLLALYRLFNQLVSKMDLCLIRTDHHVSVRDDDGEPLLIGVDWEYLNLLRALSNISKIYKGAGESIRTMLETRKATFRFLVMECAIQDIIDFEDEQNDWIFEHKEILSFECRWHLAGKFIPWFFEDGYVGGLEMLVDRSKLFADSCGLITQAVSESLQNGLSVQFKNEAATGPGVLREWFVSICKEIFDTQNALFISSSDDRRRFYINPASSVQPRHLDYFRFCGRVIGLSLLHQVQVGIAFDRVLFKQLAGLDIRLEDIKDTDPTVYQSCKKILDMDADLVDSDVLGLTFATELEEFGSRRVVEFHPGGEHLKVNSRNREKYVEKFIHHRFCVPTLNQVAHLSEGFSDTLHEPDLYLFFRCITLEDLDRVLRGSVSDISVEDWKAHTDCKGYKDTSREMIWLWKIIEKMSPEKRRLLLFFWTTVNYLPFEGFSGLPRRLEICRVTGTLDRLPTSNTCFYQLCIPRYPTYKIMRQRIAVIVQEHVASSFGKN